MAVLPNADLLIENVSVLTMDPDFPRASGIAIANDRILGVLPSSKSTWPLAKDGIRWDGGGLTIMPGLIDAHCHLRALLSKDSAVACARDEVSSIKEIIDKIQMKSKEISPGHWIRASGYDASYLSEKRHPNRFDLDQASSSHPIRLRHVTRHVSILNSAALKLAGIGKNTNDPPGMFVERDAITLEPTGFIHGGDAWLSRQIIPSLSDEELLTGIESLQARMLSFGITAVQDATPTNSVKEAMFWHSAIESGWPIAVQLMASLQNHFSLSAYISGLPRSVADKLEIGHVKVVLEALPDIHPDLSELSQIAVEAFRMNGSSLAIHVVDPVMTWTAIEAIRYMQSVFPEQGHNHRLEHLSLCPDALLPDIAELKIAVVTNPNLVHDHGDRYLADVDVSEHDWLYRMASVRQSGILLAAGSDAPVASLNPWLGIQTACTRSTFQGQTVNKNEALTRWDALELYTSAAAKVAGWGNSRGMIKTGFQADLIALEQDPLTCPVKLLHATTVRTAWIGGKLAYQL